MYEKKYLNIRRYSPLVNVFTFAFQTNVICNTQCNVHLDLGNTN